MKRLGKVLHFSKSRSLIVKLESGKPVKMGTRVHDSKLREIGVVRDIFGPVKSPYVAIAPKVVKPDEYVGRIVYVSEA